MRATTTFLTSAFNKAAGGCAAVLTLALSAVVVLGASLIGSDTDMSDY